MTDIDFNELEKSVEGLRLGDSEKLHYRGNDYLIRIRDDSPMTRKVKTPGGVEIDINRTRVPDKFKKLVILHEVLESDLEFYQHVSEDEAHALAREADNRYAKEKKFTPERMQEFEDLKG